MVAPLYELFVSSFHPFRSINCHHHVCSRRLTSVSSGLFFLKYQIAFPFSVISPSKVEYESPRMDTVFCACAATDKQASITSASQAAVLVFKFMIRYRLFVLPILMI